MNVRVDHRREARIEPYPFFVVGRRSGHERAALGATIAT